MRCQERQISQGLALPLSILPTDAEQRASQIGDDVTEILGVHKWSTPEVATGSGTAIGPMPYSIPQTDEIREKIEAGAATIGLKNFAIQGEFCGEGIQKNRLKLFTPNWFVFTLIDMDIHRRITEGPLSMKVINNDFLLM